MKKFLEEFKSFALRGNVMDMAVGVLIGGAFSGIVTSLTDNFITPVIKFVTGAQIYTYQDVLGFGSAFIGTVVNFIITALILFVLMKSINKLLTMNKKEEVVVPTTKVCPFCKSVIALDATRCPHCTSKLDEMK